MNKKALLWMILFYILFASPFLTYPFLKQFLDAANYENRTVTEKPTLTVENYADYPQAYELYFNDNIPYRNQLISLNSQLSLFAFGDSTHEDVVVGKDGWLFFTGGTNPVAQSTGRIGISEAEMSLIAARLMMAKDFLDAHGVEFVFFIAPNKESIYTDKLPDYYAPVSDTTQTMQLVDYLRENTDLCVVWPYDEMLEARNSLDCDLYSRLDTHWGNPGAYIGAKAIAKEIGLEMPALSDVPIETQVISRGDLSNMLNTSIPFGDTECQIKGYEVADTNEGEYIMEFHTPEGDPRDVVIWRDSFGSRLSKVLGHEFQNLYALQTEIERGKEADIFIYEIVERNVMSSVLDFEYFTCRAEENSDSKTLTIESEGGIRYDCISIFKQADGSEEWTPVLVAEPFTGTSLEIPAGETGKLQFYIFSDASAEQTVYETTLYY